MNELFTMSGLTKDALMLSFNSNLIVNWPIGSRNILNFSPKTWFFIPTYVAKLNNYQYEEMLERTRRKNRDNAKKKELLERLEKKKMEGNPLEWISKKKRMWREYREK